MPSAPAQPNRTTANPITAGRLTPNRFSAKRMVAAGAGLFVVALATYVVVVLANPARGWSMLDLQIYRLAGIAANHGHDVYRMQFMGLSYTYTPFSLLVFELPSRLGINALRWAMTVTSIACLVTTSWIAWGMLGLPRGLRRLGLTLGISGIGLWMEPVAHTLGFGQINLVIMLLVLADLSLPDGNRFKGVCTGVATAIKLTPAIFVAYLLVTRRVRAAVVAGATFVVTIALGFLVIPLDSRRFWIGHLFMDSSRVGGVGFVSNQSLNGILTRLFHGVALATPWWWFCAIIAGACGLAVATWAQRRGEELLGATLCGLTGLLVSPISWSHHWVWIVPGLVVMVHLAVTRRSRLAWALAGALAIAFAAGLEIIWRVPHSDLLEYTWHTWQLGVGNLYVIIGLGLLAGAAAYLRATDPNPEDISTEHLLSAGVSS